MSFSTILALRTTDSVIVSMHFVQPEPNLPLRLFVLQQNSTFLIWQWNATLLRWSFVSRGLLPRLKSMSKVSRSCLFEPRIASDRIDQRIVFCCLLFCIRNEW